jgi:hypothetical protein
VGPSQPHLTSHCNFVQYCYETMSSDSEIIQSFTKSQWALTTTQDRPFSSPSAGDFSIYLNSPSENPWSFPGRLSPDLWLKIFWYSTNVSGAFSISDHRAIVAFTRDRYGTSIHNRFREAMNVKLTVSLVCRAFNALAFQTLFEYLLIKSGDQALRIAARVEHRKADSLEEYGPGWWTTRVELALDGRQAWDHVHTKALSRILRNCPNVVILSSAFCDPRLAARVHDAFLGFKGHAKLKRLEIKGDIPFPTPVMSACSNSLEVLWASPSGWDFGIQKSSKMSLPRLHTLVSGFDKSFITEHWDMPCLRTLISDDNRDLLSCLRRTSGDLRHMRAPITTQRLISLLPEYEQLEELFISMPIPNVSLFSSSPISCVVVEYDSIHWPVDAKGVNEFLTWISSLFSKHNYPYLACLRFVTPIPPRMQACESHFPSALLPMWNSWLNIWRERQVKLESSPGVGAWIADRWQPVKPEDFFCQNLTGFC